MASENPSAARIFGMSLSCHQKGFAERLRVPFLRTSRLSCQLSQVKFAFAVVQCAAESNCVRPSENVEVVDLNFESEHRAPKVNRLEVFRCPPGTGCRSE